VLVDKSRKGGAKKTSWGKLRRNLSCFLEKGDGKKTKNKIKIGLGDRDSRRVKKKSTERREKRGAPGRGKIYPIIWHKHLKKKDRKKKKESKRKRRWGTITGTGYLARIDWAAKRSLKHHKGLNQKKKKRPKRPYKETLQPFEGVGGNVNRARCDVLKREEF